jgi:hypothetical protein
MANIKKPAREEFACADDTVTHRPTGARFMARPGTIDIHDIDYRLAGQTLPNGDLYLRGDVLRLARQLLAERL